MPYETRTLLAGCTAASISPNSGVEKRLDHAAPIVPLIDVAQRTAELANDPGKRETPLVPVICGACVSNSQSKNPGPDNASTIKRTVGRKRIFRQR